MSLESFFGSYLNDDYDVVDGTPEARRAVPPPPVPW